MGERSSTEGLDVGLQGQQSNGQGKEAKAKLAQIIQVCSPTPRDAVLRCYSDGALMDRSNLEFSHQGGTHHPTVKGPLTSCV